MLQFIKMESLIIILCKGYFEDFPSILLLSSRVTKYVLFTTRLNVMIFIKPIPHSHSRHILSQCVARYLDRYRYIFKFRKNIGYYE